MTVSTNAWSWLSQAVGSSTPSIALSHVWREAVGRQEAPPGPLVRTGEYQALYEMGRFGFHADARRRHTARFGPRNKNLTMRISEGTLAYLNEMAEPGESRADTVDRLIREAAIRRGL